MAYPDGSGGASANPNHLPERAAQPYRAILVMAMPGTISASLIHAVEREFPWVRVEQREDVAAACSSFRHPVSLILVDAALLEAAEAAAAEILHRHPHALAALIEKDGHKPSRSFSQVCGSPLIRGVLPMNLSLDIWLSVVRLMLCGGEYFPMHMFRSHAEHNGGAPAARGNGHGSAMPDDNAGPLHMDGLTTREVQILEMVARGLQNKSIAAAFSLSESTVKIHLHNIIGKLGVHNRTEAAARFRDRLAGPLSARVGPAQ